MSRDLSNFNITDARSGAAFTVRVIARAAKDEIVGVQEDGSIKIRLTAAPPEHDVNAALIAFLSTRLGVPEKGIEIVAGKDSRDKWISVSGITTGDVDTKLKADPGAQSDD